MAKYNVYIVQVFASQLNDLFLQSFQQRSKKCTVAYQSLPDVVLSDLMTIEVVPCHKLLGTQITSEGFSAMIYTHVVF